MPRLMSLVGAALAAVLVLPAAVHEGRAGQLSARTIDRGVAETAVQGLLVVGYSTPTVTIVTLAGKALPVPARVRASPFGLSPDARMVARANADSVLVGAVRGATMRSVLRGGCPSCLYGANPSFAWSPDGRRLAASVERRQGPTVLKLADRNGRVVRSFALPRTRAGSDGREYHRFISWSPDGSRLLLERSKDLEGPAVVVLDIDTGRLRTLARLSPCQAPRPAWSPDGRLVALIATSTQDCRDSLAVVDAAGGRSIFNRSWDRGTLQERPPAWAPDGRSLFLGTGGLPKRIVSLDLTGRETNLVEGSVVHVYTPAGLVYERTGSPGRSGGLTLYRFATGQSDVLITPRSGTKAVLPLSRFP